MRTMRIVGIVLAAGLLGACSNKLSGDVTVNGEKLELASCRNGGVFNFRGVELTAKSGLKLRISASQTGDGWLVVMPPGKDEGVEVGKCGTFSIADQNSTINGVKNIEGKATLDCSAAGYTVKGSVSFGNCH